MNKQFPANGIVKSIMRWFGLLFFWAGSGHLMADTYVVTSVNNSGPGSLRQAIINANTNPGPDRIEFAIPGGGPFVIRPLTPLPPLTDVVVVDGTTQSGFNGGPIIEIDGSSVSGDGLQIIAGNSVVRGLALTHCSRDGIRITGPRGTNVISGNYIGLTASGAAGGNGNAGVNIYRSSGNIIGGTSAAARNVISGGNSVGIYLVDAASINNQISGNYVGVTPDGGRISGNQNYGIYILGAPANIIGGLGAGAGNVISGNGQYGVLIANRTTTGGAAGTSATNNLVVGNFIGTDASGSRGLGNTNYGISIQGAAGNMVGGSTPAARNVISGNKQYGIIVGLAGSSNNWIQGNYVGLAVDGVTALSNGLSGIVVDAPANGVGGTNSGAGNVASGNGEYGIYLGPRSGGCVVAGNFIGTDGSGTSAIGNAKTGLRVESAANLIGGLNSGARNIIAGNTNSGVYIYGVGASNNVIQGNSIGLNLSGAVLSNAWHGISISNAPGTVIGGVGASGRNWISGNGYSGIALAGTNATGTYIQGNYIGTDLTGVKRRGNLDCGIFLQFSPSNTIGGTGLGNVIADSAADGIRIEGVQARGNLIQGNYIGTDVSGSNRLGNAGYGVIITNGPANTIGGSVPGAGNLVSANGGDGIQVSGASATGNIIQGNWVGTKVDGSSALGNGAHGIEIAGAAGATLIGGTVADADNHVAFNGQNGGGYDGVRIRAGCIGNFISRNGIFSNNPFGLYNSLGIDCGDDGVTSNGVPVLSGVTSGSQTVISGSLKASANTVYRVQFYSSPATNVAGYGEGMHYLDTQTVTTDSKGIANFAATIAGVAANDSFVTATATDPAGTTTEFSRAVPVAVAAAAALGAAQTVVPLPPSVPPALDDSGTASVPPVPPVLPFRRTQDGGDLVDPATTAALPSNAAAVDFVYTQPELIALRTNGPASNRLNIVFFPEGYVTNELAQFLTDAQRAADGLLSAPPYSEYRNYCNIYAIVVPSEQSGTSHPEWPLSRNTYFHTSYDSSLDYILTMPPNEQDTNYANGEGKIAALLQQFMPNCELPVVLVNEIVPGGSGGGVCITSFGEPFPELMIHESGHTLSHLGDEYTASRDYAGSLDADTEPNTTKETRRSFVKWKSWIADSTPVPTPEFAQYSRVIGLFEGAHYNATGWYRPKSDCIMRQMDSGAPFCEVCAEAQVEAIYKQVRPIDATSPAGDLAFVPTNQSRVFTVTPMQPLTHNLSIQWSLDGVPIPGATNPTCEIAWSTVAGRSANLRAMVIDATSLVRIDPTQLLQQSVSWTVAPAGFPVAAGISVQPLNQSVRMGSNAVLSVGARGSEPISYQWRHAGVDLTGATNAELALTDVQTTDAGVYSVIVSNEFGRVTSTNAVITVGVPVSVQIAGPGTVKTNYNGQWLDYGKTYTMTALPALRCLFSNWSGTISTNKPKLTFTPTAGMQLIATFTDPVKPTLAITSPAEHARLTNDAVKITGNAGDNAGVGSVRYRLNGGDWITAVTTNHWTNWTSSIMVPAGANTIEALSVDSVGNLSASALRHFTRVVLQPLVLQTNGIGSVSPNLDGKPLELGQSYSVTAIPGKGQLFAGWSTGERSAALKFQMLSNMVLQASFVTNPFVALSGVYNGLFQTGGNTSLETSGLLKFTVDTLGSFTGTLIGPSTFGFSGKFWVDGTAQVTIRRSGKPSLVLDLTLDVADNSDRIRGHVTDGTWQADLQCDRAHAGAVTPGLYTLALMSADEQQWGDGIGSVKVDGSGGVRLTGTLADGTAINQSTAVSRDGLWPFYVSLYGGKGSINSWISFTNLQSESLTGMALWTKTAFRGTYYPAGFTNDVQITGSTFQPVKSGTRILGLTNAVVSFIGANIAEPQINSIALSSNNVVSVSGGTNSLKLPITTSTGLINGSFVMPGARSASAWHGVLLQQSDSARGFFLGKTNSGTFLLEPAGQ